MFGVDRKIPTLMSTVPEGNSASLVSYWNGGPSDWDFPVSTEHRWWILFFSYQAKIFWNRDIHAVDVQLREELLIYWININKK